MMQVPTIQGEGPVYSIVDSTWVKKLGDMADHAYNGLTWDWCWSCGKPWPFVGAQSEITCPPCRREQS